MTKKFAKQLNKQVLKTFEYIMGSEDLGHLCGDDGDEQLYNIWDEARKEFVETCTKLSDICDLIINK